MDFLLYLLLITQIFIDKNVANCEKIPEDINAKLPPKLYERTAEILHRIKKTNIEEKGGTDVDYIGMSNNKQTENSSIMRLLTKSYDSDKAFDKMSNGIRIHVISNPEVLKVYKNLRSKDRSTSSSSEDDSYDEDSDFRRTLNLRDVVSRLRRQAVFRIDNPSSAEDDEKVDPELNQDDFKVTRNHFQSAEDDQLQYAGKAFEKYVNMENRKQERASNEDIEIDNWDIITKKYDWDAKDLADSVDIVRKKDKPKSERDEGKKEKSKGALNNWDENNPKKEQGKTYWSEKEESSKKEITNNDWDTKKADFDDQNEGDTKNNWEELPRKKKSKEFTKEVNKRKKDHNKSWNEKRKVKITDDWNVVTVWGKSVKRPTTRREWKKPDFRINEWDNFMTKERSKPKKYDHIQRNGPLLSGFGRTSIPVIGRQGIYEDK